MKEILKSQGTQEWLSWRQKGIGSSDIAAIMGVCPFKSALDVYKEKLGGEGQVVNKWMQRGKDNEVYARIRFCEDTGKTFEPLTICHEDNERFIASLDGYCLSTKEVLEIKTPGRKTVDMAAKGEIPIHYIFQIQWQLFVSGSELAYYFCDSPDTFEEYTIEVTPNYQLQGRLKEEAEKFLDQLDSGVLPDDGEDFLEDEVKRAKLDRMGDLKKEIKNLTDQYDALKKDLGYEGTRTIKSDRYKFVRSVRSSVDYKKAATDCVKNFGFDLSIYEKPVTISWTIKEI